MNSLTPADRQGTLRRLEIFARGEWKGAFSSDAMRAAHLPLDHILYKSHKDHQLCGPSSGYWEDPQRTAASFWFTGFGWELWGARLAELCAEEGLPVRVRFAPEIHRVVWGDQYQVAVIEAAMAASGQIENEF